MAEGQTFSNSKRAKVELYETMNQPTPEAVLRSNAVSPVASKAIRGFTLIEISLFWP